MKNIFISFAIEDKFARDHLVHQAEQARVPFSFAESFPQKIVSAKLRPLCFRFPRRDWFQKMFEFCTMNTAKIGRSR